ncbi:4-diphosphocytidyl-2-C-methyl-D-erythritol kinase [Keratinibaculum paraultunense]|uniref:4-diphosphocytidyl-2-C-methyl-D-erythritol kinase n=1 Tax=Keratinibaculum paraultunense TaxID=1278232 RepID=A0A4R3KWE9_9FIRM|nr:4-(cytidine 5'-diphospho)-2-C-methyl-D-erythritol kinase [Keratinibaculum paraultunense]QQY79900.1 4-(cytidine 5'-diphospho)-2-C-methyl-D-erythritol kinase [Keratinibaculum paraultunense]TCS88790.1 4-diphosphocytidyl-2-C-methyl-D-erythritol kinase [Keratinibaculum paraultunense]
MGEIILNSYGKINLALDVLYKRDDGYHEIKTIMQQIDLKDTIMLRDIDEGIIIESNQKGVPLDSTNLVYKAWEEMVKKTGINRGIHITIDKNIPIAAGLAGGSSNAAATIKGLNTLWELNLSQEELMEIGVTIGADVPFCIQGGTAYAQGIGEKLTPLNKFSNKLVLLANIDVSIPTAYVYESLNLDAKDNKKDINKLIEYIQKDNLPLLAQNMFNVMEKVVVSKYPILEKIKRTMMEHGALGSLMSGSGPTVFGLFDNESKLYSCKKELEKYVNKIFVCKTI